MASPPKTLSQYHLNLLRNDILKFEICPLVHQTIIEWGFEKPDGVTIKRHMENRKIEEEAKKSGIDLRLSNRLRGKFCEKDFTSFDVTTLHELLPIFCYDKVAQLCTPESKKKLKDTNSIEYLLEQIKNYRNEVSHSHSKAIGDPNIKVKQELLEKCIRTAGTIYGKDQSEIDGKIAHLEAKFDALVHETVTYESAVKHVKEFVEKENAPFMLEKYSYLFSIPLPGGLGKVGTAQIFESVHLSVAVEDKDITNTVKDVTVDDKDDKKKKRTVFSSNEICNHVTNKFVVINGGPGSGKTTLLRNVYQNILDNSVNESKLSYEGIDRFKVPIYLECRTERLNNLRDFLKESVPNISSHKDVIYDALKEVEGKVFLIDGYDEVNDDSRKLVDEIIPFCSKYNAICIVSGRADAGNNFIIDLQKRNLSYDEMLIEHISKMSDKLSFLRRYGVKMRDINSEELVKSFKNLNEPVQKVFVSPILLALFISLFLNNERSLSQLHNEQSAYKAITEIFSKEIESKMREIEVPTPKQRTKDILAVFSYYSLSLFKSKEYFFKEKDYDNLIRDCEKELTRNVDFEKLLTCILTPETSFKQDKSLTYAFTHSTIQEYLAVEQIIKNMIVLKIDCNSEQHSEDSLRENFLKSLEFSTAGYGVKWEVDRYGNIIKLLMLETLDNGELANFTKTFTAVLREYFRPEYGSPVFLLDLVFSSNCHPAIVSIVSNVLKNRERYELRYTRHIRPLTDVLKKKKTIVYIEFDCTESLTDSDCANLGQLVSVLEVDSEIRLDLNHSHDHYQPLTGEFYTQLKKSKCKVTYFKACVSSSEHLSIMMEGESRYSLHISTVSASDVRFDTLEEHERELNLRVKFTDDCASIDSNPVTGRTKLTIADIHANGKDNVYYILKSLCPKSKQFYRIFLVNCHLTDRDTNELLKKLEEQNIRTEEGKRTEFKMERMNNDKSRNLTLFLADLEKREAEEPAAEQREVELREAAQQETEQRKAEQLEAAQLKVSQLEAELREAKLREAEQRKNELRENEQREAKLRENELREAAQQETEQRKVELREAAQLKVSQLEAELREAKLREHEQRESFLKSVFLIVVIGWLIFQYNRSN